MLFMREIQRDRDGKGLSKLVNGQKEQRKMNLKAEKWVLGCTDAETLWKSKLVHRHCYCSIITHNFGIILDRLHTELSFGTKLKGGHMKGDDITIHVHSRRRPYRGWRGRAHRASGRKRHSLSPAWACRRRGQWQPRRWPKSSGAPCPRRPSPSGRLVGVDCDSSPRLYPHHQQIPD